jgi:hypothetical protein
LPNKQFGLQVKELRKYHDFFVSRLPGSGIELDGMCSLGSLWSLLASAPRLALGSEYGFPSHVRQESKMASELKSLVEADKSIPVLRGWTTTDRHYLSLVSPLDIDGVTIEGLQIRLGAHELSPNEAIRAQLEFHPPKGRCEPLCRLEWRPLTTHNNKGRGPPEFRFKPFRQTHVHPFDLNWDSQRNRLLSPNLPIAVPLQDVDSYNAFLDLCSRWLMIRNMSMVPSPPWQVRML